MAQPDQVCNKCAQPMMGRPWIKPPNQNMIWHLDCFQCAICLKTMTNQTYALKNYLPVCKEHIKEEGLKITKLCDKCQNQIHERCVYVRDRFFHKECFLCSCCQERIPINNWYDKENKVFCKRCYDKSYAITCCRCNKKISGAIITTMNSYSFCGDCFKCCICRNAITQGKYFDLADRLYCLNCEMAYRNEKYTMDKCKGGA